MEAADQKPPEWLDQLAKKSSSAAGAATSRPSGIANEDDRTKAAW